MNHERSDVSARERELLLLRAQTREPEALSLLFESCRRRLYGRALRILARPLDAEDALQEAMFAAFTHLHRFQRRADFLTWTTRINAALQQIRKRATRSTVALDRVDSEGASCSEYLRDPQPTPEEQLQTLERWELLEGALRKFAGRDASSDRPFQVYGFLKEGCKRGWTAGGNDESASPSRETGANGPPHKEKRIFDVNRRLTNVLWSSAQLSKKFVHRVNGKPTNLRTHFPKSLREHGDSIRLRCLRFDMSAPDQPFAL